MTGTFHSSAAAVREAWSALALQGRELAERAADRLRPEHDFYRPRVAAHRSPVPRKLLIAGGAVAGAALVSCGLMWWQLSTVSSCGTLAGALIPELVKVFTSTHSRHVGEIVTSSRDSFSK